MGQLCPDYINRTATTALFAPRVECNVYCRRGAAIPLFCPQRYGLRAELQLDPQWRPTLRERLTVMLSSGPLVGDNGSTHSLSDVYYIQVHLSFRGSWPRVTPRAIKPDCGPNLAGTGTQGLKGLPGGVTWARKPERVFWPKSLQS